MIILCELAGILQKTGAPRRLTGTWIVMGIMYGACFISGCASSSADEIQRPGFFSTIYRDQPLKASLAFNLDSVRHYSAAEEEVEGWFTIHSDSVLTVPVEIRARGITRKKLCDFPPLRIQLKKSAVTRNSWGDYRNYKLVTHCSDTLRDEELLLREYLVYKLYAELTDIHLRTQLLDMSYILTEDTLHHFAFLIENEAEMNERLGLRELDIEKTSVRSIHFDHYKRFVLFQYMVGNTDWNPGTGHNTKYVLAPESKTPIVVPYDFDYCGLVNASYARPYPTLPISDVRERYFMYRGKKDDDFSAAVQDFLNKKQIWYSIVDQFPYLSVESRKDVRAYLEEFFSIIEQPDWKERLFPS